VIEAPTLIRRPPADTPIARWYALVEHCARDTIASALDDPDIAIRRVDLRPVGTPAPPASASVAFVEPAAAITARIEATLETELEMRAVVRGPQREVLCRVTLRIHVKRRSRASGPVRADGSGPSVRPSRPATSSRRTS
jgi:hypothetical protein